MFGMDERFIIFHNDRNASRKYHKYQKPQAMIVISVYRSPWHSFQLLSAISNVLHKYKGTPTCVIIYFNEDLLLSSNKWLSNLFGQFGFKQHVTKLTRDSGTLINHVFMYICSNVTTDVWYCYDSDHDYVVSAINSYAIFITNVIKLCTLCRR